MSASQTPPLISVVTATYNMGRYLRQAVQSVLAQSYGNLELLVVDDGSTDDTSMVIADLVHDPRVRLYRQENGGQAKAKNKGIAMSRGSFIGFLDADDVWLPGKLESQMALFRHRPALGVVYSDYDSMDANGERLPKGRTRMHRGLVSGKLLIENFISFPSALVRKECFERFGAFDESLGMGIDYELWLRLSPHYEFDFVAEPTVRYRIWPGQMSRNYRKRYAAGIGIMKRFLDANPYAVDRSLVNEAWAHTYTGRGEVLLWAEHDRRAAICDYWRALSYKPGYWPAWRAILRSLVTARPPRED